MVLTLLSDLLESTRTCKTKPKYLLSNINWERRFYENTFDPKNECSLDEIGKPKVSTPESKGLTALKPSPFSNFG